MESLVLDTSVIVEYIILRSPYRSKVVKLLDKASREDLKLYVNVITLSELLYAASRIYQIAEVENPNLEALNLIEWIKSKTRIVDINEDIALRAGELKKQLRIALPDCYVIAVSETVGATPLFKKLEKKMEPIVDKLRELDVKFLDEIEP